MYVIKINLAPARFELGTFCLERIIYSTEPQLLTRVNRVNRVNLVNPCYILCYLFSYLKNIYIYIYIYIINKLLKKKITITIITIRNYSIIIRICYVRMRSIKF